MFDSGITAKALIEEVKSEADIALDIPDESYVSWLNSLEQMLYSEVIKEQGEKLYDINDAEAFSGVLPLVDGNKNENEDDIRFEDIHAVYADGVQLIKTTLASGKIFPNVYFKSDKNVGVMTDSKVSEYRIIYHVRPSLKVIENGNVTGNVMIPVEFLDLAKAKLRGEAYKIANEGELAAMWLNDYNILLETFKNWIAGKQPMFGL